MKDLIYIPHQDRWNEHFPNPGSNKKDYTLYLSDPPSPVSYVTTYKTETKKTIIPITQVQPPQTNDK